MSKPIVLHLGDDVKWNHDLYKRFSEVFEIKRSYSMPRQEFIEALKTKKFGDVYAIWRPFYATGGEMGRWDAELIFMPRVPPASTGSTSDLLAKRGVVYCNSAAACTEAVADAAIYLIINTFRHFTKSALGARSLDPKRFQEVQHGLSWVTFNPRGHTLGIIGLGRIGQRTAQKAYAAFPMKIVYNDIRRMPEAVERETEAQFFENLDDMLAVSDCVLVATPFGGSKVLDADKISKMKQGSRLVNIARGKLIDEDALVKALESGQLQSAALDVHFDEPNVNPKLAAMESVELTCHNAGVCVDSMKGFETMSMENILRFHETGKALTPVNLHFFETSTS